MALEKLTKKLFSSLAVGLSTFMITHCEDQTKLIKIKEPYIPIEKVVERCIDNDQDLFYSENDCGTLVDCDDNDSTKWQYQSLYFDQDKDGYGSGEPLTLCSGWLEDGYSRNNHDCDDSNPHINPLGKEYCNGLDDDCDPDTRDGSYELIHNTLQQGVCKHSLQSCIDGILKNDYSSINEYQELETLCDDLDNDCDGDIDEICGGVVFEEIQDTFSSIKTIKWDGSEIKTVIGSTLATYLDPSWSPDGKSLIYSKYKLHPNETALHVYDLNTQITVEISNTIAQGADWCKTGTTTEIIFVRNYNIWRMNPGIGQSSEYKIHEPKENFYPQPLRYNPKCSPNGEFISYTYVVDSSESPSNGRFLNFFIGTSDINGVNEDIINLSWPRQRSFHNKAAWNDDNSLIISSDFGNAPGNNELYLIDKTGDLASLQRLTQDSEHFYLLPFSGTFDDTNPCVSRDGRYLAFTSKRTGNWQLYRMKLADRSIIQITSSSSSVSNSIGNILNLDCY